MNQNNENVNYCICGNESPYNLYCDECQALQQQQEYE